MNIGKYFKNPKSLITIVIALAVALALLVTLAVFLNKENNELPTGTDGTTQTDPSGSESTDPTTTDPVVTTYTVTFKDHDGTVLKTETVEEGKSATAPADPTREGYTFEGWDKAFDKITADLEVTANYKANDPAVTTYTVTFKDYNGNVLKTQTVEKGKAATAPANPSRDGYTFEGWDKSFNNITSDLVVTATYKAVTPAVTTYTVTFKDYNGTVLKTQKVEKGKAATAPANPSREGYTFEGWDKAFNNITSDLVVTATYKAVPPAVVNYTVTFKDYNGKVLGTQTVEKGKAATAPANPSREHFTFAGWDKSFNNVTSDLVVTATYTTSKIVISAESVTVNKGTGEVTVNIRVYNNPGIMGAVLKVSVNDQMFSFKSASKAGFPSLTLTAPGPSTTSSPYTFMLDALELSGDDRKDGTLFSITFKIDNTNAAGTYDVKLSYNNKGIFDENYNYPNVSLENGTITIK